MAGCFCSGSECGRCSRSPLHPRKRRSTDEAGLAAAYVSILLLTLANPATILSFLAVFAGLGHRNAAEQFCRRCSMLVTGVFLGSATWWLLLSLLAGLLRARLNDGRMRIVNVIAGLSILSLGLWSLVAGGRSEALVNRPDCPHRFSAR